MLTYYKTFGLKKVYYTQHSRGFGVGDKKVFYNRKLFLHILNYFLFEIYFSFKRNMYSVEKYKEDNKGHQNTK